MPDDSYRSPNPGHFGPAVIGEEQAEAERDMVEKGAHVFGPSVVDSHPATDEEGKRKEVDRSESPGLEAREPVGALPADLELIHTGGGFYVAEVTEGYVLPSGELTEDRDVAMEHKYGRGKETATEQVEAVFASEAPDAGPERPVDSEPGPSVTEGTPHEATDVELQVREASDDAGHVALDDLEELLEGATDALRDRLIDSEFGRADGTRIDGLRLLIEGETQREDGPRARVLNRLERALAQKQAEPES